MSIGEGERILDIGTFTGGLLEVLLAAGADAYGVELQAEAVEIANALLGEERVFRANVHGTSFPAGPYDVVSMIALIEHVTDPREMVRRAHQLLRPGGRFYLETPDAGRLLARVAGPWWPPLVPIEHIHLFSHESLGLLLAQEGFENIAVRRHIKWLPVSFVDEQLSTFGPSLRRAFHPFARLLGDARLPFYGGEMLVSAVRR
jgi:SAM-dependent methyltransferase